MTARTQVNLTEEVSGVMPVANGGTGLGTLSAGYALVGNGTSTVTLVAPSTAGNVLQSSGSTWISQALTRVQVPEANTTSSATSLTLTTTSSTWTFTGSSPTTWTLPTVSSSTGFELHIENRGTAAITIIPAGADHIWLRGSVTTMTVAPNGSLTLGDDGTYWNAYSLDIINNSASLTSIPLTTPTITGYTETVQAMGTVGSAATIPALSGGTVITATLTASTATTFTMPTASAGQSFVLILKQPSSTGNGSATFTSVKWPSSGTPTITTTAGKNDILSFISDGTDWYGNYAQGYTY